MKKMLSVLIFLGAFTGTAAARTPASFYALPYESDYRESGSAAFTGEDMQSGRPDLGGLQNRFDFSGIGRLYIPHLGSPSSTVLFGNHLGDSGHRQFGFGASRILGPVHTSFTYQTTSDLSGPLASGSKAFGGTFTLAGGLKLYGLYQLDRNDLLQDSRDTREWILGASVPFGANTFMASYIRHINKTMDNADASRFSFAYDYSLSKQTQLYTSFSHLLNEGGMLRLYAPGDGENQFNAGIRHQF